MRHIFAALIALVVSGCATQHSRGPQDTEAAKLAKSEAFIDAFYSFDRSRLNAVLAGAQESLPKIGFYQGWAEGGNYRIVKRERCVHASAEAVRCSITVKDDLIPALGLSFDVTDTFHIKFAEDQIAEVRTTSNDPPLFEEAMQWVGREKPEVLAGPCKGFFDGGPTPGDCVRAVVRGFAEFVATRR